MQTDRHLPVFRPPELTWRCRGFAWLVLALPVVVLIGWPTLMGRVIAFRDSGHFYYPLYQYLTKTGFPLWNPLDYLGLPIVADVSSGLFYPGRLLFLVGLPLPLTFNLFLALHVLIAAGGTFELTMRFQGRLSAGVLAGACYGLSGTILSCTCNPVFLVSGSWLPWAMLGWWSVFSAKCWQRALIDSTGVAICLSLMTLGGDPQAVYHFGLVALFHSLGVAVVATIRWWRQSATEATATTETGSETQASLGGEAGQGASERANVRGAAGTSQGDNNLSNWFPVLWLAGIVGLTFFLTAIQVLPAIRWSRQSYRAVHNFPRSVYEIPGYLREEGTDWDGVEQGLFGKPTPGTHAAAIYEFSFAPWRVVELGIPGCLGQMLPINARWDQAWNYPSRLWNLTVYCGLIPLLLAGYACWVFRRCAVVQFLVVLAIGALSAAMGGYGVVWLLRGIAGRLGGAPFEEFNGAVGGPYWTLVTMLPGYCLFRYPAKWLVFFNLAVAVLAGIGWARISTAAEPPAADQDARNPVGVSSAGVDAPVVSSFAISLLGWLLLTIAMAAVVLLAVLQSYTAVWLGWVSKIRPDAYFGPFAMEGARQQLLVGLWQIVVVGGLGAVTLRVLRSRGGAGDRAGNHDLAAWLLVGIVIGDLCFANAWVTQSVPAEQWHGVPQSRPTSAKLPAILDASSPTADTPTSDQATNQPIPRRAFRAAMSGWFPFTWGNDVSPQRLTDAVAWEHHSLYPRHHLLANIGLVEAASSLEPADQQVAMEVSRAYGKDRGDGAAAPDVAWLQMLGVDFVVVPAATKLAGTMPTGTATSLENSRTYRFAVPHHRVWLVDDVVTQSPLRSVRGVRLYAHTRDILYPDGQLRNFRRQAIVETDAPLPGKSSTAAGDANAPTSDSCRIIDYRAEQVTVRVESTKSQLLVLSDTFDPDWSASLQQDQGDWQPLPVYRTNRIMRGVFVPPGSYTVRFLYRPWLLYVGIYISGLAWGIVVLVSLVVAVRRRFSRG